MYPALRLGSNYSASGFVVNHMDVTRDFFSLFLLAIWHDPRLALKDKTSCARYTFLTVIGFNVKMKVFTDMTHLLHS